MPEPDHFRVEKSPALVAAFLFLLALPQVVGFTTQFVEGFVPFKTAPGRVIFSWDMFAPPIERCALKWLPPLKIGKSVISNFNQMGTTIEWDIAFERVQDYLDAAVKYCSKWGIRGNKAQIDCFHLDGTISHNEFACH